LERKREDAPAEPEGLPGEVEAPLPRDLLALWPLVHYSRRPMSTAATKALETFPNPKPERDYEIRFDCPEFTCLCPKTGQPDFARIEIRYVPDALCVELKSLKLYLWSYRDEGAFHEAVTNRILDDLVEATAPRQMTVVGGFWVRGGIATTVTASYRKEG
jgi:7-cyano-7-deazaguanine reductase